MDKRYDGHTPGPWTLCNDGCKCGLVFGGEGESLVAEVVGPEYRIDDLVLKPSKERQAANARLIAAAPELLEELEVARAEIAKRDAEIERLRQSVMKENEAICQTLGQALGYPWFCDDPKNFPDATDLDGVCVGDHVAATLAQEAADRLRAQAGQWQPVEDGEWSHGIIMRNNEIGFSKLAIEGGQIITIADSNVGVAVHCLNDDLRLCRLVEQEWLDAPDGEGWWAFSGNHIFVECTSDVTGIYKIDTTVELGIWYASTVYGKTYLTTYMHGKWQRLHIAWPEVGS
jgi:hypothetical protein